MKTGNKVTGNCLKRLPGHTSYITSVRFDGEGLLASGSWDYSIRLWEVSSENCLKTLEGHSDSVWSVNFDEKGLLASGSDVKSIACGRSQLETALRHLKGTFILLGAFILKGKDFWQVA